MKKGKQYLGIILANIFLIPIVLGCIIPHAESRPLQSLSTGNQCVPRLMGNWTFLGLEDNWISSLATTKDYLYAAAYRSGVYRKDIHNPQSSWEYLGFGGDRWATSVYVHPLAPNVVYVGLAGPGGLYKSINGGETWFALDFPADDGGMPFPYYVVTCITGTTRNPHIVYVTTMFSVFRSQDSGDSWVELRRNEFLGINTFAVNPSDPMNLWVGGESNGFAPFLDKSTDGGLTWDYCIIPYGGDNAVDSIALDPTNSSTVFLGMEGKVMKTTDGGDSWKTILHPSIGRYFYGLAVRPSKPHCLYAGGATSEPYIPLDLYKSTTGGSTWSHSVEERGMNIATFEFDENDNNILYVGSGSGVWKFREIQTQQTE